MTILGWAVMLGSVTIDASNKTVRVVEGGVTVDVTLVEGTYYLKGDGVLGSDLVEAFRVALQSHSGVNTYSASVAFNPSESAPTAVVTFTRTGGANAVDIQFGASQTTFPAAMLGFPTATVSLAGATIVSTKSPASIWVADEVFVSFEPRKQRSVYVNRAKSGVVRGGARSATFKVQRLEFAMLDEKRVDSTRIAADPDRALDQFIDYVGDGKDFRLYFADMSAGVVSSPGTEQGDRWLFAPESLADYEPIRMEPGVALYDVGFTLYGFVTA